MVVVVVRCNLGQTRDGASQFCDVFEVEVNSAFVRNCQQVQDGVRGSTHRHIQCHRVVEGILVRDVTRQDGIIFLVVVAVAEVNDHFACAHEQVAASNLGGEG